MYNKDWTGFVDCGDDIHICSNRLKSSKIELIPIFQVH